MGVAGGGRGPGRITGPEPLTTRQRVPSSSTSYKHSSRHQHQHHYMATLRAHHYIDSITSRPPPDFIDFTELKSHQAATTKLSNKYKNARETQSYYTVLQSAPITAPVASTPGEGTTLYTRHVVGGQNRYINLLGGDNRLPVGDKRI